MLYSPCSQTLHTCWHSLASSVSVVVSGTTAPSQSPSTSQSPEAGSSGGNSEQSAAPVTQSEQVEELRPVQREYCMHGCRKGKFAAAFTARPQTMEYALDVFLVLVVFLEKLFLSKFFETKVVAVLMR